MLLTVQFQEKLYFLTSIFIFISSTNAAPQLKKKEEMRCPNGTVIGKYSYIDNEGNPVQIKYFADDNSYGVELHSLKVIHSDKQDKAEKNKNPKKEKDRSTEENNIDFESKLDEKSAFENVLGNNFIDYTENMNGDNVHVLSDGVRRKRVKRNLK